MMTDIRRNVVYSLFQFQPQPQVQVSSEVVWQLTVDNSCNNRTYAKLSVTPPSRRYLYRPEGGVTYQRAALRNRA
jgi:hypothetical protein